MEMIGTLIVWAVLGLAIGAAAKRLTPWPDGGGFLMTRRMLKRGGSAA